MIKFQTFLEAKNTASYIDHNDEKQIVDLSGYQIEKSGNYVTSNNNGFHSFDDMPAFIGKEVFYWLDNGDMHRDNNLPAEIRKKSLFWRKEGLHHRTNGPALLSKYFSTSGGPSLYLGEFYVAGSVKSEDEYVKIFQDNIIERIKEYPLDIRLYKIPNFKLQKVALDKDFSVSRLIKKFHPDLKDTKYAHLVSAGNVGLLDA